MSSSSSTPAGTPVFHADHGVSQAHLEFVDDALSIRRWGGGFVSLVLGIPHDLSDLRSALYGPAAGDLPVEEDQVVYARRGSRPGPSRLVDWPTRPIRTVVVIAGPSKMGPAIYTCYGGPFAAPREWWDVSMKPREALEAASFWCVHALARE